MTRPLVVRDDFWSDFMNTLFLRPIYRKESHLLDEVENSIQEHIVSDESLADKSNAGTHHIDIRRENVSEENETELPRPLPDQESLIPLQVLVKLRTLEKKAREQAFRRPDITDSLATFIRINSKTLKGISSDTKDLSNIITAYAEVLGRISQYSPSATGLDLRDAWLCNADLTHANLDRANLKGVDLTNSKLSEASLIGADISEAKLNRTNLTNAKLAKAKFHESNLAMSNFTGADLSNAMFEKTILTETTFRDANLSNVQFIESNFDKADLIGAIVEGAYRTLLRNGQRISLPLDLGNNIANRSDQVVA